MLENPECQSRTDNADTLATLVTQEDKQNKTNKNNTQCLNDEHHRHDPTKLGVNPCAPEGQAILGNAYSQVG